MLDYAKAMEPSRKDATDEPELDIAPDGVDLSLIRWMLSLTPMERLEVLQDFVDGVLTLRDGRVED
jgi:hypothetical protein